MYIFNLYVTIKFSYELRHWFSRHPNSRYQITHAKFKLKIFYLPPYERVVWYYQNSNNDLIQRSISRFNWEWGLSKKGVNKQILIFNVTILNIVINFIPHEIKIFNDREPIWINIKMKTMIQWFKKKDTKSISFPIIHDNKFVTDFIWKTHFLILFFFKTMLNYWEKQCYPLID